MAGSDRRYGNCRFGYFQRLYDRRMDTGEWTSVKPEFIEDKCKQCLLCVPVCPDSCIPVKDMKRGAFDYDHCKGCGICVKACPFGAITMEGVK